MDAHATNDRLLIGATEAAQLLSVSPRTLWTLTAAGELPVVRIGRAVRYRLADLNELIRRCSTDSAAQQEGNT